MIAAYHARQHDLAAPSRTIFGDERLDGGVAPSVAAGGVEYVGDVLDDGCDPGAVRGKASELQRVGARMAWPSTKAALRAVGVSTLLELTSALLATVVWIIGVTIT